MTREILLRWSGLAAMIGGAFIVLPRVLQVSLFGTAPLSEQAASPLFLPVLGIPGLLGSLGFLLGLVGLYARQAEQAGFPGFLAFLIAFAEVALSLGANWGYAFVAPYLEGQDPGLLDRGFADPGWGLLGAGFSYSYLAGGIGWLAMGISTLAAGVLPRWVGLVMLGSILLTAVAPLEIHGPGGILLNILLSAGPVAVGYALWTGPGRTDALSDSGPA